MTLQSYIVDVYTTGKFPQLMEVRVLAWSAQDAVFQTDFNHCRKSKVLKDGEWVQESTVYSVRPDAPGVPKP